MEFKSLVHKAIEAAKAAGTVIREAANKDVAVDHKAGGNTYASQVVTAIDRQCDRLIRNILQPISETYAIGFLTEEVPDDGSRFTQDYFWCVDPLDGTLAFINKEPGFAVSIALISKQGEPVIGVVYNPMTDQLYHATKGEGVFLNGDAWSLPQKNPTTLTYLSDKTLSDTPNATHIQNLLQEKATKLGLSEIQEIYGGGAVWNAIRVLEEAPGCMIKLPKQEQGGGSIWDYAATVCIFHELGLQATRFSGEPLDLNPTESTFMNAQGIMYSSII